jgi:hypothetical protein
MTPNELAEVVLDVANRTIGGEQFKDRDLVDVLHATLMRREDIVHAFLASHKAAMSLVVCTDHRIIIVARRIESFSMWSALTVSLANIVDAEVEDKKNNDGFLAGLLRSVMPPFAIRTRDGDTLSFTSLDPRGMDAFVTLITQAVHRNKSSNRHTGSFREPSTSDDLEALLEEVEQVIAAVARSRPQLGADAMMDLETLRSELSKSRPNARVVSMVLDGLERLPLLASAIEAIRREIGL